MVAEKSAAFRHSTDAKKRDLQLEATAHICVQRWIDEGGLSASAVAVSSMREVHRRFCSHLPEDLLWVEDDETHRRSKVLMSHAMFLQTLDTGALWSVARRLARVPPATDAASCAQGFGTAGSVPAASAPELRARDRRPCPP